MASLQALALSLSLTVVVLFGLAAVLYALIRQRRQDHPDSSEFFLTARHSVGAFTIAWAFYAGAMGSWALFGPPSYCLYAGTLGVIMYAVASGIPIFVIGSLGGIIHDLVPDVLSFSDFVQRRFGIVLSVYVSLVMLFNMGVAITAEFTAVGDLFAYVIGVSRVPVVVTIGVVSILYTAVGGLFVSIVTDQWQAVCNVVFILILVIYVAITFRGPVTPAPDWGNYYGLSAVAVMPISLITSTLFSEAMWQRCWATSTRKSLLLGSVLGGCMVICAVFIFGFGGVLALWGNKWVPAGPDDTGNTILFSLFNNETWVLVIVTLLSVVMSESAVDSLQNAIVDTMATMFANIATHLSLAYPSLESHLSFMKVLNLWWIRSLVLVLNVAPIIVSLQGYNVLQLFLLANLITTTTAVPVFSGIAQGRLSRIIVTPFSVLFGCANGIGSLFWWSAVQANSQGISYSEALYNTFLVAYDWPPFMIGLGCSIGGMLLGAALEFAVRLVRGLEYPKFPLNPGLPGQISESTAAIMAHAFSENSDQSKGDPRGIGYDAPALGSQDALLADALPSQNP